MAEVGGSGGAGRREDKSVREGVGSLIKAYRVRTPAGYVSGNEKKEYREKRSLSH